MHQTELEFRPEWKLNLTCESDREFSCDQNEDDDSDSDNFIKAHHHNLSLDLSFADASHSLNPTLYLLGRRYHPINDFADRREDELRHLTWFTYRANFEEISPYGIRSDAGWGCMLRSIQMMLAQALKMHYCGREWCWPRSFVQRRSDYFIRTFLTWFADFPSVSLWKEDTTNSTIPLTDKIRQGIHSWYSLHNMVAAGMARYETLPGEWFGPNTACLIVRDLCARHNRIWKLLQSDGPEVVVDRNSKETDVGQDSFTNKISAKYSQSGVGKSSKGNSLLQKPPLKVYVAQEGCVYRPIIEELMAGSGSSTENHATTVDLVSMGHNSNGQDKEQTKRIDEMVDSVDKMESGFIVRNEKQRLRACDDPLTHLLSSSDCNKGIATNQRDVQGNHPQWDTALLLLIPLRLGLKSFNAQSYRSSLAHTFSLRQSVGFVGGSPRHALWFYSALSDGSKVHGLDPHTIHNAPLLRHSTDIGFDSLERGFQEYQIDLTDEFLRSVQCPSNPSVLEFSKIDPSLALGFYCRDRADFESWCHSISKMNEACSSLRLPALFNISDLHPPDYDADVTTSVVDLLCTSKDINGVEMYNEEGSDSGRMSDEDEYVVL